MKFFFSLLFLSLSLLSFSQDFEYNGIYYTVTSFADLTCEVSKVPDGSNQYFGDIVIPESVSGLDRTFSVTGIGAYAFAQNIISDSQPLINSVSLPDCIETIGVGAFASCRFSDLKFPANLRYIGDSAFTGSYLKNVVLPDGVETIADACFCSSSLETITLSNSLQNIPINCFADCANLKSLVIPNSVKVISGGALARCSALETLTIGENVTDISRIYFCSDSPNLKTIYCLNQYTPVFFSEYSWSVEKPFSTPVYLNTTLVVPTGSIERFKATAPWNNFQHIEETDFSSVDNVAIDYMKVPMLYFNTNGISSAVPSNGFNIVKYSDGTYSKVLF